MSEPPDGKATFYPASSGSGSAPSGTEAETGRLPSDLSAERALVGGLLLSNDQLDQFTDFLRPEHFYETLHGRIYREIVDMYSGGRTADLISINPRMEGDEGYN
ncbi:MAG: DnaB-like helicase N-terminal domain-containing protein, partial [Pseudomonadota bacterium]